MTVISPYYAATSFLLFHSPTPLGCDAPSRGGQARNTSLHLERVVRFCRGFLGVARTFLMKFADRQWRIDRDRPEEA